MNYWNFWAHCARVSATRSALATSGVLSSSKSERLVQNWKKCKSTPIPKTVLGAASNTAYCLPVNKMSDAILFSLSLTKITSRSYDENNQYVTCNVLPDYNKNMH